MSPLNRDRQSSSTPAQVPQGQRDAVDGAGQVRRVVWGFRRGAWYCDECGRQFISAHALGAHLCRGSK